MTKVKHTKGFTLVELLVVIAIIAILAGALFLVINPAKLMAKTRDSRRVSELTEVNKGIANSLADGKITLGAYGTLANDTATGTTTGADGWVRFVLPVGSPGMVDYMRVLPRDPLRGAGAGAVTSFYYRFASTLTTWELNAWLENIDNAAIATNDGGSANTCTTMPAVACVFEVGTEPGLDLM